MALRASEILLATSLGLGYLGATGMAVGAEEIVTVGKATADCIDVMGDVLTKPLDSTFDLECSLSRSAAEISRNPSEFAKPLVIGNIAVATAVSITNSKRRADVRVNSFRWSPRAFKGRIT